jgi:hypothetical protein
MLAEIRTLVDNGYFQSRAGTGSQVIATAGAPTLEKFRATADVDEAISAEHVGIHPSVRMWKPGQLSLFAECVERIADKTKKAAKYTSMPEWLIIQVVAPPDVFAYDLSEHEMKSLGPFQKVFVLHWHIDGLPYLANWTVGADGAIVPDIPELAIIEEPYDEPLHEWADAVERVLEPRRILAWLKAGSGDEVPKRTTSPLGVQWYRRWHGRYPWVTCESNGERIRAYFWTEGDWANRETADVDPDEVAGTAEQIWDFIVPHEAV